LIANNIKHLTKDAMNPMISDVDIFNIKEVRISFEKFIILFKNKTKTINHH